MNKDFLREFYKKRRDELYSAGEINTISNLILKKITDTEYFKTAKNIMFFYPKGSELNLTGLIKDNNFKEKIFYLPVCCNDEINVCPFKNGDKLILNKYKIYEPETEPLDNIEILDLIITPALCAGMNFHRIGYGKGYYDRFFALNNLKAKKVVVLPDEFLLESIPADKFDMPCDLIITEKRTLKNS